MLELVASILLATSLPISAAAVYDLPCTPVDVYPPAGMLPYPELRGPTLCVVDTDIRPERARLYLDGVFVATGAELARLVQPLAVAPGRHVVEALVPGRVVAHDELEVAPGELATVALRVAD